MQVQPYLFFDGRCEEALNYYRAALGAEIVMLSRFRENPDPSMAMPGIPGDKVMHASFRVGDSTILASDGACHGKASFAGFSLSISADSEAQAKTLFARLSDGGQVQMPLTKTFFSPAFGMVADKFGVSWMIVVGK